MGDYSRYFGHHELYHPDDVPPVMCQANLRLLAANVLDPVREANGAPLIVTSGFRGYRHNASVGGASNSQHCLGNAADVVDGRGRPGAHLLRIVCDLLKDKGLEDLGGLGVYWPENEPGSFLHLDRRPRIGGAITVWYQDRHGRYVSPPAWLGAQLRAAGIKWTG